MLMLPFVSGALKENAFRLVFNRFALAESVLSKKDPVPEGVTPDTSTGKPIKDDKKVLRLRWLSIALSLDENYLVNRNYKQ